MRFNKLDLYTLSQRPAQLEGRLQHRAPPGTFRETGFRERFFKLIGNLLFYFRISDLGQVEDEPTGVIVLENYTVNPEPESISFAFRVVFRDESEKKHVFTARTEPDMERWIATLRTSSYQYWKHEFVKLSAQLEAILANGAMNKTRQCPPPPPPTSGASQNQAEGDIIKNTAEAEEDLIRF